MTLIARIIKIFALSSFILLLISGCAAPTPVEVIVTQLVPQTVIVTQIVTREVTSVPSPTTLPEITPSPTSAVANFDFYYPFPNTDCGLSIVHVGDQVYVSYGGTSNALRRTPDSRFPTNVIGYAIQGEILDVVGGPECNYGLVMWKVKTSYGLTGWTAEGNGTDFWLIPTN